MPHRSIDLNADLGETDGDLALMRIVTSANIACGGHAGDEESMSAAVEAALASGVAVGAHASYRDRSGFGRIELGLPPGRIAADVVAQVSELAAIAGRAGGAVAYLKLHGALYHRANHDVECATALVRSLSDAGCGPLQVLARPGSALLAAGRDFGWQAIEEGYCDRSYRRDGSLTDRAEPGAVHHSPAAAARQAVEIAVGGGVRALDGSWVTLRADSLCVHGDTPDALEVVAAVRRALERAGVRLAPFASS